MLHELDRDIGFYRIRLESVPLEKNQIPLSEAIGQLAALHESSSAHWVHRKGKQSLRLIDFNADHPNFYIMLVSLSKTEIADPSFEHIFTGNFRTEHKQEHEGISYSAHLLIDKTVNREHGGESHRVLLERIPGMGSTIINPFLSHVFKKAYELNPRVFWYREDNRLYRPRVHLSGDLSTSLREQMQKGRVTGIELIDHRDANSDIDEDGHLVETKATLQLRIVGDPDDNALAGVINKVKRSARRYQFDEVKIKVTREDTGDQTIPISIDVDTDATETLAIRKEKVSVLEPLGQRHSEIRDDLVEQIALVE